MIVDLFIKLWLCRSWLIHFVMAVAAVTYKIQHTVFFEFMRILIRQLNRADTRNRIIGIYADDRNLISFCQIARITSGASFFPVSRESNQVIRNDMKRTADAIPFKSAQVHRFRNDSFSDERSISVNEHADCFIEVLFRISFFRANILGGACEPGYYWIYELQMRRVVCHFDSRCRLF